MRSDRGGWRRERRRESRDADSDDLVKIKTVVRDGCVREEDFICSESESWESDDSSDDVKSESESESEVESDDADDDVSDRSLSEEVEELESSELESSELESSEESSDSEVSAWARSLSGLASTLICESNKRRR